MEQIINHNNIDFCPLCYAKKNNVIEVIKVQALKDLYKKSYDFDISYLINSYEHIYLNKCNNCNLIFFQPNLSGDEKFYQMLQKTPNYYFENKYEYQAVIKYFNNDLDVLEIGAGKGAFSKIVPFKSYTGLELSDNAVKIARDEGIKLYNQKVQDFIPPDNKKQYDIVVSFQVLEHVKLAELNSFISSSLSLLKKGGKLMICVPSNSTFMGTTPNITLNLPPHHLTRWPDETFEKMENLFNMRLIEKIYEPLKEVNYNPYFISRIFEYLNIKRKIVQENKPFFEKTLNKIIKAIPQNFKEFMVNKINPRGHSIIVVYERI